MDEVIGWTVAVIGAPSDPSEPARQTHPCIHSLHHAPAVGFCHPVSLAPMIVSVAYGLPPRSAWLRGCMPLPPPATSRRNLVAALLWHAAALPVECHAVPALAHGGDPAMARRRSTRKREWSTIESSPQRALARSQASPQSLLAVCAVCAASVGGGGAGVAGLPVERRGAGGGCLAYLAAARSVHAQAVANVTIASFNYMPQSVGDTSRRTRASCRSSTQVRGRTRDHRFVHFPPVLCVSQVVYILSSSFDETSVRPTCSERNCATIWRCTCSLWAVLLLKEATVGSLSRRRLLQDFWRCWSCSGDRFVKATPLCTQQ